MKKGILALIFILSIFICCSCRNNEGEDDYDDATSIKEEFIDETINFAKAAETAYVSDSLYGAGKNCYTIDELKENYISSSDSNYKGKVIISVKDDEIDKTITFTDGNFYVVNANPLKINKRDVLEYNASEWNSINNNSTCN